MAEVLEVLHFSQQDGVAEVEVRRGGIESDFHRERLAGLREALELGLELAGADDVHAALGEVRELFFNGHNGGHNRKLYRSQPFRQYLRPIIPTT